jgi:flagellar biosynthesis protein FlhA
VSILPSLLVSVAGGIVVTRAASKESLGVNVSKQLFNSPRLFWIAGGALTALGLIPGLPKFSFFSLAAILMYSAYKMKPQVINDEGAELARWELRRDCLLAISSNADAADLPGQDTREPAFDVPAKWISPQTQGQAIAAGYAVVDPTSVLAAHLAEVIRQNAHELLSRHETRRLVDRLIESHPKLADELIPKLMSLGEVQKVLQQLLREQVSIRDLGTILETLVDAASFNKNPIALVEAVRHVLGRTLIRPLLNEKGELKVVTLDSAIEEECTRGSNLQPNQAPSVPHQLSLARRVLDGLRTNFGKEIGAAPPILLCSSPGRYYLRRLLEPFIPKIVVISPGEIPPLTPVQSLGVLH